MASQRRGRQWRELVGRGLSSSRFAILSWEQVRRPCRNAQGLGWSRALGSRGMPGLGRQEQGLPAPCLHSSQGDLSPWRPGGDWVLLGLSALRFPHL